MSVSTVSVQASVANPWQQAGAEFERRDAAEVEAVEPDQAAEERFEPTEKAGVAIEKARRDQQQRDRRAHRKSIAQTAEMLGKLDLNTLVRLAEMLSESRSAPPVPKVNISTAQAEIRARVMSRTAGLLAGISRVELNGWRSVLMYITHEENPAVALGDVTGGRLFPRY